METSHIELSYAVITTIQGPTPCMVELAAILRPMNMPLLVIGDSKGPFEYELEGTELWTLNAQAALPYSLASRLPTKHYTRKNLGYLIAISKGAACIYETDDDNAPSPTWRFRREETEAVVLEQSPWINAYRWFTNKHIWPRGFPIELIRAEATMPRPARPGTSMLRAPIQQGLADRSPDVDAVWRLVLDEDFSFDVAESIFLPPGSWCPFNSQTTWWWPEAYPLLYLPSRCSFRMTDIWRSFVAQRCLWELGFGLVFHPPEVYQDRNEHSLLDDFRAEVPGYTQNAAIVLVLDKTELDSGVANVGRNLLRCYGALCKAGFFPAEELRLVEAWLLDLEALSSHRANS